MKISFTIVLILCALILACDSSILIDDENPILKTWILDEIDTERQAYIYFSSPNFHDDKAGYSFKKNGDLIVRQNSGWCGTPPISYDNFNGDWKFKSDSIINISCDYWATEQGSPLLEYSFKILEIDKNQLIIQKQF